MSFGLRFLWTLLFISIIDFFSNIFIFIFSFFLPIFFRFSIFHEKKNRKKKSKLVAEGDSKKSKMPWWPRGTITCKIMVLADGDIILTNQNRFIDYVVSLANQMLGLLKQDILCQQRHNSNLSVTTCFIIIPCDFNWRRNILWTLIIT